MMYKGDAIFKAIQALQQHVGDDAIRRMDTTGAIMSGEGRGWERWLVGPLKDGDSEELVWLNFTYHKATQYPKLYGTLIGTVIVQDCDDGEFLNIQACIENGADSMKRYLNEHGHEKVYA